MASITISSNNAVTLSSGNSLSVNGTFSDGGTFTGSSSSTVYFGGTASISGGGTTIFYNLGVNSSATVTTAVSFSIVGTFTNSGSFTATAGIITFNSSTAQSIGGGTFYNLYISTTNSATISMTGNVTVNYLLRMQGTGNLIVGANTLTLYGSGISYPSSKVDATNASSTVVISSTMNISSYAFVSNAVNNLTINNNAILTANSYTINGVLTIASGATLNLQTYALTAGAAFSTSGTGKLQTQYNSNSALPSPFTYTFTVEYNSTTQPQVLPSGCTFSNLTLSNTYGAVTVFGGVSSTVDVSGVLAINSGAVLNMGTSTLLGTYTTSGTGTLQTQSVSATPIPSGRTFTFDVLYLSLIHI